MQRSKSRWIGDRQFYRTALAVGVPLMFQQLITSSVNLVDVYKRQFMGNVKNWEILDNKGIVKIID